MHRLFKSDDMRSQDWEWVHAMPDMDYTAQVTVESPGGRAVQRRSRKIQVEKKGKRWTQQSKDHPVILHQLRMLK